MIKAMSFMIYFSFVLGCDNSAGAPGEDSETEGDSTVDLSEDDSETSSEPDIGEFSVEAALASDFDPEAPGTVGIVTWSLGNVVPDSAEIRFGLDTNYGMAAPVDLDDPDYRTLLLGMKSSRTYHFQVTAVVGDRQVASPDYTIETGPVTNLVNVTPTVRDAASHASGFIVSTFVSMASTRQPESEFLVTGSMAFILDGDGDVVWWYQSKVGLTPRARMSYDGKSMWLAPEREDTYGAAIERVRMDTLENTVYDIVDGASHDAAVVDDEVLAYIDYGEPDCGSVFELNKDGTEKEIFESTDYLPGLVMPQCHLNAVRYNEAEDLYTVSDRNNEIFVIDREGTILQRLSEIVPNETYGGEQHGHQLLTDSILLFANAGGEFGASAAVEYSLTDGTELFRYDPGIRSVWYGDVQRLPGGNTLVTFSLGGAIHEIDGEGNLLMEIRGEIFGYTEWRPTLYGPPVDIQM